MRRLVKYLAVLLALILVVFSVGIVVASNMFDSKVQSIIAMVNRRQSALKINYEPVSNSILNKQGILKVKVPSTPFGEISADFDVSVDFSFSSFKATFNKVNNSGNLDELLSKLGVPTVNLEGALAFYPWQLKGGGVLKTSAFSIGLEDGQCRFGENAFSLSGRSKKSLDIKFASAGIKCRGYKKYQGRDAYSLDFLDIAARAKPLIDLEHKSLSLDKVTLSFKTFDLDTSTIYMIGFEPDDKVRDPSVRDRFTLSDFAVDLSVSEPDVSGRQKVISDGTMNIAYGVPYIKEGKELALFDLSDIKYDVSIGSFNFMNLIKSLKTAPEPSKLLNAVSMPIELRVNSFALKHAGQNASASGYAKVFLDEISAKIKNADVRLAARADRTFVDPLLESQQEQGLFDLIQSGQVTLNKGEYSTVLEISGKDVKLNGHEFNPNDDDEDPNAKNPEKSLDE